MPSNRFALRLAAAAVTCSASLVVAVPSALAEPATDDQGFIDSTARCASVAATVAFGRTETSRVAICKTSSGGYEYRGVRMRDGARLITPASSSAAGVFVVENDGTSYTVSANSLTVSADSKTIRQEPMLFFQGPASATAPAPVSAPAPAPSSTTPRPTPVNPLPAEVGGSAS